MRRNFAGQVAEGRESISIARNQLSLTVLEVSQGAEAVELQLEDPVGMIKRARAANKPHGFTAQEHGLSILSKENAQLCHCLLNENLPPSINRPLPRCLTKPGPGVFPW